MKRILIILLSAFCLTSCTENPSKKYILFSGKIENATKKEYRMVKNKGGSGRVDIILAEDGSFTDTITSGTGHYILTDSRNRADFYLTDGGEYHFTGVANDFRNTAKLTGTDPDASNYLMTKYERINRVRGDYTEYNSLNESDFLTREAMLNKSYLSYLDSFANIPEEFAQFERDELYNYHLLSLIKYEFLHGYYTKQPDFKVSKDFLKELEGVDYVNEKAYKLRGSYNKLVIEHFKRKASDFSESEGLDEYLAKLKVFGDIPNDHIKNDLLLSAAKYDIGYTDDFEKYYKNYLSVSTSDENDKIITEKYQGLKKLTLGQPSPVFKDYVNHAGGTTSLADFKGKYVYIDVWATWCAPCLAEVPSLKKIEKQYHGKNIEFLSISIDIEKVRPAWRKMVTDKKLGGTQLIAESDWSSEFIKEYQINSIPRFIMIDPSGKIVNSNAPRPSSPELLDLFNELGI
ncbi:hypothetical protein GCM10011416_14570 [Polaribacter pacificus]|uniref:Thioredoxin domain-containing protein n=1 Tax=Polaribacter pacificus TaxID=1775173 RepID=A0A917HZE0_9FLAO|nr:TlpA disulfide reductase family protein [Polaribacter pacificus]GGG97619.1 hypothetical protein GCM10011416_14570 [Polaribacter pacificus]